MKKILNVFTAVVVIGSTAAFATCQGDVNLSQNKIINVGAGSADGDAVNYAQTLKLTKGVLPRADDDRVGEGSINYTKVGKEVCIYIADVRNISDTDISQKSAYIATIPEELRPIMDLKMVLEQSRKPDLSASSGTLLGRVTAKGFIQVYTYDYNNDWRENNWNVNTRITGSICYHTN